MYIGGLQILPAPPLKLLKQTHKEGTCVVCMARPSQYGLVVSERGLVLRYCAAYCVKDGACAPVQVISSMCLSWKIGLELSHSVWLQIPVDSAIELQQQNPVDLVNTRVKQEPYELHGLAHHLPSPGFAWPPP